MAGEERIERVPALEDGGKRLDVFLREKTDLSRSRIASLIREGRVWINDEPAAKPSEEIAPGQRIRMTVPPPVPAQAEAEDLPLVILWEDESMAVIDKPCGMVVHPAAGNESGTLVNALLYHLHDLSGIGGEQRPGIVHRLDKDTSGVLVVAKNDAAHMNLARQFQARTMEKHYAAIVSGTMKSESGRIDAPIGRHPENRKKMAVRADGRSAVTEWQLAEALRGCSFLDVHILTGRTHQIRVHMASVGHPVLGDPIYGQQGKGTLRAPRLMLHAERISLDHPRTGERMTFVSPLPEAFEVFRQKHR